MPRVEKMQYLYNTVSVVRFLAGSDIILQCLRIHNGEWQRPTETLAKDKGFKHPLRQTDGQYFGRDEGEYEVQDRASDVLNDDKELHVELVHLVQYGLTLAVGGCWELIDCSIEIVVDV